MTPQTRRWRPGLVLLQKFLGPLPDLRTLPDDELRRLAVEASRWLTVLRAEIERRSARHAE
ncbi:MAG TPA: hypothetical protein VNJ11_01065 [Bryobacteraceae bacterium]|nr:hypothetical protein [Bryobacteraceae bacterium]